jgi:hypothetical protein
MLRKLDNQPFLRDNCGQGRGQDVMRIQEINACSAFVVNKAGFGLCGSCISAGFVIEAATSFASDRETYSLNSEHFSWNQTLPDIFKR